MCWLLSLYLCGMNVEIVKNTVYQHVKSLTAQVAKIAGSFELVAVSEDNYPILDMYLGVSVAWVEGALRNYLSSSNQIDVQVSENSITLSIEDGIRPNPATRNLAETSIRVALAMHVAGQWLQTTEARDHGEVYLTGANQELKLALSAVVSRDRAIVGEDDYMATSGDSSVIGEATGVADFETRQDDGSVIGDGGAGFSMYGNSQADDVPVDNCWKHVHVHVCDDVPD